MLCTSSLAKIEWIQGRTFAHLVRSCGGLGNPLIRQRKLQIIPSLEAPYRQIYKCFRRQLIGSPRPTYSSRLMRLLNKIVSVVDTLEIIHWSAPPCCWVLNPVDAGGSKNNAATPAPYLKHLSLNKPCQGVDGDEVLHNLLTPSSQYLESRGPVLSSSHAIVSVPF